MILKYKDMLKEPAGCINVSRSQKKQYKSSCKIILRIKMAL